MYRLLVTFVAVLLGSGMGAEAQMITTVAGSPEAEGFAGDGGPATDALLDSPTGVAIDATGNLYIADSLNHRVRRVDLSGIIQTVAGDGTWWDCRDGVPATATCLDRPGAVAVDVAGNLFIVENGNNRVSKVDPAGTITTVAASIGNGFCGDGGPATAACLSPRAVAVDAAGNLYIADWYNHRIRRVDLTGTISTFAGNGVDWYCGDGGPATSGCLSYPYGVAVDTEGNVFVADVGNNRVRKIDAAGIIVTVAGNGSVGFCGDHGPATSACLNWPGNVALDRAGNLFISDSSHRVRRVDVTGRIDTVAGSRTRGFCGDGGWPTDACLEFPGGLAVDETGTLVIAEFVGRIRRVDGLAAHIVSLTLSSPLIAGCRTTRGEVTLALPSVGSTAVMLTSDDPNVVVPAFVRVAAGADSKSFLVQTQAVANTALGILGASTGWNDASTALTLRPMRLKSLTLSPRTVPGGTTAQGTIALECAAGPGDVVVSLFSNRPDTAAPAVDTVTIPRGAASALFQVTTAPVASSQRATITATSDDVQKRATLTVTP